MGCDWAANLFTASSFEVAQYEICNVKSFHAQTHCFKKRIRYVHEDFAGLAYDCDGYDSDFSRRLAKTSPDSVYHGDGLIDASNANAPLTTGNPAVTSSGLVFAYHELKDNTAGAATLRTVATGANVAVGVVTTLTSAAAATRRVDYTASGVAIGDIVLLEPQTKTHLYRNGYHLDKCSYYKRHYFINCGCGRGYNNRCASLFGC